MRPGRQDLTFRSCRQLDGRQAPCRPLGGRQAPIFENFPIRHIFLKFCFLKYKNEKKARALGRLRAQRRLRVHRRPFFWGISNHVSSKICSSVNQFSDQST